MDTSAREGPTAGRVVRAISAARRLLGFKLGASERMLEIVLGGTLECLGDAVVCRAALGRRSKTIHAFIVSEAKKTIATE